MKDLIKAWNKFINNDLIKEELNTNLQSMTSATTAADSAQQVNTAAVKKETKLKIDTLNKEIKGLEATINNKKLEMTRLKDELSKLEETTGFQGKQEGSIGNAPVSIPENQDMCEIYEGITEEGELCEIEYEDSEQAQGCGQCEACKQEASLNEAEYKGKKVTLRKKMPGDVKKYKVYVRKPNGKIVKVNFGDKKMRIKKSNPERKKSFIARHRCDKPGPPWKARYWSCRNWK